MTEVVLSKENSQEMGPEVLVGFLLMAVIQGGLIYWKLGSWIVNPNQPEPKPLRYMQLVILSLGGMIATGLILTRLYAKFDEETTPLMAWYGYNNICMVFDYYPSTFVMPSYFNLVSMFALQFAIKDTKRLLNSSAPDGLKMFGRILNICFVLITVFFSTCLAIGPRTNMYIHTTPFLMMICVWPCVFLVHLYSVPKDKRPMAIQIGIYLLAILSWTKGCCTFIALTHSAVPPNIGQLIDRAWTLVFIISPFVLFIEHDEDESTTEVLLAK